MIRGTVRVNTDYCKSCLFCVTFCPKEVLELGGELNALGYQAVIFAKPENCNGCALCARMCPDAVLTVEKEEYV